MSRSLTVFLPVPTDAVAAVEDVLLSDPAVWLPDARAAGPSIYRCSVRLGPVARDVACEIGDVRDEPGSLWRDLTWSPVAHAGDKFPVHEALPTFSGEIGLHRAHAVLVLNGTYEVPGGRLGELTDAVALGHAARATGNRFLADIVTSANVALAAS